MLDVTAEKSESATAKPLTPTKLVLPKTPTTPGADRQIGSSRRTISPSPMRYGIWSCERELCDAS